MQMKLELISFDGCLLMRVILKVPELVTVWLYWKWIKDVFHFHFDIYGKQKIAREEKFSGIQEKQVFFIKRPYYAYFL